MAHIVLRPGTAAPQRTLLVMGASRSMTSLVAGGMHESGLDFGADVDGFYESTGLSETMERGDSSAFAEQVAVRNAADVWAWKRPSIVNHMDLVFAHLRAPHVIVVVRDVAAIALSKKKVNPALDAARMAANMVTNLRIQQACIERCLARAVPLCVLSAEKMVADPEPAIRAGAGFFGVDLDSDRLRAFLDKGNAAYRAYARLRADAAGGQ
ncbi:MAG: hypothetical protein NXH82_04715 [Rhodobacteraceae bacterium]|nr:hypothetical protein [Paracoccaceae bacterium]